MSKNNQTLQDQYVKALQKIDKQYDKKSNSDTERANAISSLNQEFKEKYAQQAKTQDQVAPE